MPTFLVFLVVSTRVKHSSANYALALLMLCVCPFHLRAHVRMIFAPTLLRSPYKKHPHAHAYASHPHTSECSVCNTHAYPHTQHTHLNTRKHAPHQFSQRQARVTGASLPICARGCCCCSTIIVIGIIIASHRYGHRSTRGC